MSTVKGLRWDEQENGSSRSTSQTTTEAPSKSSLTGAFAKWFVTPRITPKFGGPEAVILLLYCAILLFATPFHEPWSDEAQAWMLARDCPLGRIFFHYLHYEGTPGLWHLILWVANRLHLPFGSLNYISGGFAAAAVYVWLRYAPFPRLFRYLLPFTFYVQYQYAVVARNYSLFAISVFLLVWLYTEKKPRPLVFAIIAGLAANESMHGALFAAGIFVAYILEQRYRRKHAFALVAKPNQLWLAAAILTVCGAFAFWTAFPAPDNSDPLNSESVVSKPGVLKLRAFVTGIPIAPSSKPNFPLASSAPAPKAPAPVALSDALSMKLRLANALLTYPISTSFTLAYLFLLSAAVFLLLYTGLRALLPYAFMLPAMVLVHTADHHAGLLFIALLGGLWTAWHAKSQNKRQLRWVDVSFSTLLAIVLVLQVGWAFRAIRTDHRGLYDAGQETAQFLKNDAPGKTIVSFGFMSTSIQPYFTRSPFANHPEAFWTWSTRQGVLESPERITALHPDLLIITLVRYEPEFLSNSVFPGRKPFVEGPLLGLEAESWVMSHFRETHRFCANELGRDGVVANRCNVIFERP